ncbi:MAG: hypothetical protein ONB48_05650 [candidate division KSB1 bacterium]|nr:hypothetical protein [candidate division KSB1 bacterium]MDZ7273032.1 hypothetical protein [candidate division KSB1 bacterium]MDZ7285135.1 hypothetical protein [candidate division KSB1 bacterium]MDZ7298167.1 hypothetical protein [candidate division KSB1 bacterium]MDZ7306921.1 hypothetical protein [candidate division KSB1 bacterium]
MEKLQRGWDGFYHPRSEDEVRTLILHARREGCQTRVRGSGHSVNRAIYTEDFGRAHRAGLDLMLDQLSFTPGNPDDKVRIDAKNKTVAVKAGCHLGFDPYDPAGVSSWQNSLLYQLAQQGLGVADLGGIIHQAVGGFISTGSSGGSLQDSFGEAIIGLKLIDGTGKLHELTRAGGDDKFFAAGVSMGLLGIITEVTFSLVENFNIIGEQSTTDIDKTPIDLFGNGTAGKPSLQNFLYQKDFPYIRLMWWPQQKVERFVVWKAKKMQSSDYNSATGTPQDFKPQPYWEFPRFGKFNFKTKRFAADIPTEGPSELMAEGAGGLFYSIVGNWHQAVALLKPGFLAKCALKIVDWLFPKQILPAVLKAFNPRDSDPDPVSGKPSGPQKFWDYYWSSLPMDNRVDDKLVPTDFTEIWIPISHTAEVMRTMRDFYKKGGYKATGSYSCELYSAKKSDFWLSPSFGEDMFRVDIFWFGYNADDPQQVYYPQFWKLLMPRFPCRFHWGKYLPVDPNYLRAQYPKWEAFMKLRAEMDPQQIFVTPYWRERLGVSAK